MELVSGLSFSALMLYQGDDVDLIPADKMAVALAVTGVSNGTKVVFQEGSTTITFRYSKEISEKTGVSSYVALVDANLDMGKLVNKDLYALTSSGSPTITFGDSNGDGLVNAQDALAVVDCWLRKGDAHTEDTILTLNVNGDSRLNTFDALGIVEAFVSGSDHGVVTKAASLATNR